jgi:hypothetical protein
VQSPLIGEEHSHQNTAPPAQQELGLPAPVAVPASLLLVLDSQMYGSPRIGHVRGAMFAAEIAVAGPWTIRWGLLRQLQLHPDVAAVATAIHPMHECCLKIASRILVRGSLT